MDDLGAPLKQAFAELAKGGPSCAEPVEAVRRRIMLRKRHRLEATGTFAVVVAVSGLALAIAGTPTHGTSNNAGTTPATPGPAQTSHQPASTGSVTFQIRLDSTVAPANGVPITGLLVVENNTAKPVTAPVTCASWLNIELTNPQIPYQPSIPLAGCASVRVPVGVSHYPITISTRYHTCVQAGTPSAAAPACVGPNTDEIPPLPPGRYTTATLPRSSATFVGPPPVSVTLTQP